MTFLLTLFVAMYCVFLLTMLVGWVLIRRQPMPVRSTSPQPVTIVITLRNEEENVPELFQNLGSMAFHGKYEVILVNDHSTDRTAATIERLISTYPGMRLLHLPDGKEGKKEALHFGVEHAQYDVIATTDADCRMSKNWLTCLSSYFERPETMMVVGAVRLTGNNSLLSRLQVMEFIGLTASTAAAVGLGHPLMCNGANLSYRKKAFLDVNGYEGNRHIASGDDEFLMRKINSRYPKGVAFLNYYEAVVSTLAQKTMSQFYFQRIRWAGKWKQNPDVLTRVMAVFVVIAHLAFLGLALYAMYYQTSPEPVVYFKVFLEGVFVFWAGRFLDYRFDILSFLVWQLLYPLYAATIGLLSLFSSYNWKGRVYKGHSMPA